MSREIQVRDPNRPSDPAHEIINGNDGPALRINQQGVGNAIEVVDSAGNIKWAIDRLGGGGGSNGAALTAAKYRLVSDGTNVTAYDATGSVVAGPSNDFSAVMAALMPAANGPGVYIALRNDGNIFPNRSDFSVPKGLTSKLIIDGGGSVVQAAVSAGRNCLNFNRTADFDTFQNFEVWDLVFDRNNFAAASSETIFGNERGGAYSQRVNFDRIAFRRVRTINVPTRGAGSLTSIGLCSGHLASSEGTQTTITNITIEDCDLGGDYGWAIMGVAASGGSVTAGLGVNVFIDEIHIVRGSHDTGTVPTSFAAQGCQVGGYGYSRKVRITDFTQKNSGDVGIEIDNCQDLVGRGVRVVDAWNTKYLVGNFRPPIDVRTQRNVWDKCYCDNVALDRTNRQSRDFEIFGSPNNASAVDFGELVVDGFESADSISTSPFVGSQHFLATSVNFRKATLRGKIGYSALNVTTGGNSFAGIQFRNTSAESEVELDITYVLAGTRSGTGNNQWSMTSCNGSDLRLRARVAFDVSGFSGLTTASDTFYWIGVALLGASTIKCESLTPVCLKALSATQGSHNGVFFSSNWTLGGTRAYVEKMDMAKAVAGAGFDVNFQAAGAKPNVVIRQTVSQRASGASGPNTAPQGLTGLVSGTGVTIGSVTAGKSAVVQFVQGSGAGITAIDFSTNGGTNYTNLLSQAAGALPAGADLVVGPLPPDALVKVAFTTTQPTVNLVPAND